MEKNLLSFFDSVSDVLHAYRKNGVFPNIELSLPPILWDEAETRLREAAKKIDPPPSNDDPMGHFGKWHIAANILQEQLSDECEEQRGYRLPLGDWSHRALMKVARRAWGSS